MAAQKRKNTGREISGRLLSIESVLSIYSLEPDALYLPSQVATRITTEPVRRKKLAHRMRNWIKYHCHDPEGKVGSHNAWYGRTWQSFIDDADLDRASDLVAFSEILARRALKLEELERTSEPVSPPKTQVSGVGEMMDLVEVVETVPKPSTRSKSSSNWWVAAFVLAASLVLFFVRDRIVPEREPQGGDELQAILSMTDASQMPDVAAFTDLLMEGVKEMKPRRIVAPDLLGDDDYLSMMFMEAPDGALFPIRIPDTLTPIPIL